MNGRFLEKLIVYREKNRLAIGRLFITQKIRNQFSVINQKEMGKKYIDMIQQADTIETLMLIEARAAKKYWHEYGILLNTKIIWHGRHPHSKDHANVLLDIGYHYLAQKISSLCEEINVPTELGFFHKAQSAHAEPFVYDYMEWLRPFCVDKTLLTFAKRKKKVILKINEKDIARMVYVIKKRFHANYYNRKVQYCITLEYWTKLVLLEFIGSVNSGHPFKPIFPTLRHENRCKTKPPRKTESG